MLRLSSFRISRPRISRTSARNLVREQLLDLLCVSYQYRRLLTWFGRCRNVRSQRYDISRQRHDHGRRRMRAL
ncbi:unnamed protein product [Cylicocyclus nassatus]|uniref:Uncharacterized protein n=1 Tax=Cylicocyclus nassatus TaxID=53992 RepID=A0AA36MBS0_CYLNA|nr:unnamed protein product [Cylicocyclus nassatus]